MEVNLPENLRLIAEKVLASYRAGTPVVIIAKDEGILHGAETLQMIIRSGSLSGGLQALVIRGIDREEFEVSDLPEICEAARDVWLGQPPE